MLDIEKYYKIFRMPEQKLLRYCHIFLTSQGYKGIKTCRDFVYAPGELPVLLVAHADTVHEMHATKSAKRFLHGVNIFRDPEQHVVWSPQGIGADDRAGIIAILETIKAGYKPSILITTGEERGGVGVHAFCETGLLDNNLPKFFLEVDRSGSDDVVYYECDGEDLYFEKFIQSFGFKHQWGTYSDISTLMVHYRICGANLAAGYYNEHSKEEFLNYQELYHTIQKLQKILKVSPKQEMFSFVPTPVGRKGMYGYDFHDDEYYFGKYEDVEWGEDDIPDRGRMMCGNVKCNNRLEVGTEIEYGYCLDCLGRGSLS